MKVRATVLIAVVTSTSKKQRQSKTINLQNKK